MHEQPIFRTVTMFVFLVLGVFGLACAQAAVVTSISVDTSSLNGQAGFLDFQFNPGDSTAEFASATVANFLAGSAILDPSSTNTGDAIGSLPSTLTLDNGTAYNDIFQGIIFSNSFSFDLTLSGLALDNPGGTIGSSFAISLYAADAITPLLTTDPNGSVATINLNAIGTTSAETFPQSSTDNTPVAVATLESSAVPEPSSMVLFASMLPAGVLVFRRRGERSHRHGKGHRVQK